MAHWHFRSVFLIIILWQASKGERVRYDNYHVYRVQPNTEAALSTIKHLESKRSSYILMDPPPHYVGMNVYLLVAPQSVRYFEVLLKWHSIVHELLDRNIQQKFDEGQQVAVPSDDINDYSWTEYHELNDTYNWLYTLAAEFAEVSTFVAGDTYEGRNILGVKISYGNNRKSIFLEGGIHAAEWIGPAVVTYITNQLLTSTNSEVRLVAEAFDWYIVPHANPDGYVYSHTADRIWRKTRTPYANGCYGADPNRNWDFHWNETDADGDPCSIHYSGPYPFSEVETRTFAKFLATLKNELFLYVTYHSYSQLILFPYGHTSELPPNYADLKRVFDVALEAVQRRYGTKYGGGTIYEAIYPAAGGSMDWVYGVLGVPYAYCYELRPTRRQFWINVRLPAEQIIPNGEEALDSLVEMVKEAGIRR